MQINLESLSEYRSSARCSVKEPQNNIHVLAKRVNLISKLSNLRRERRREALNSCVTCFKIVSVAEEK